MNRRTAALLFVALALAGCGPRLPGGVSSREAFERQVLGASAREARYAVGAPDEVLPGRALPSRALTVAESEARTQAAGSGAGDPGYQVWSYRGRTLHPWDGRPDSLTLVQFEGGRVARVLYPDDPPVNLTPPAAPQWPHFP
jgi:hypothetical protein